MNTTDKSINVLFAKGKLYETKEVALHVTFKCGRVFHFVENFIICKINDVNLILGTSHFYLDSRCEVQTSALLVCYDGKDASLKLTNNPMVGRTKLNLVLMDQINDEQIVVKV